MCQTYDGQNHLTAVVLNVFFAARYLCSRIGSAQHELSIPILVVCDLKRISLQQRTFGTGPLPSLLRCCRLVDLEENNVQILLLQGIEHSTLEPISEHLDIFTIEFDKLEASSGTYVGLSKKLIAQEGQRNAYGNGYDRKRLFRI